MVFPIQNNYQETDYLYYESFFDSSLKEKNFQNKILSVTFDSENYINQTKLFDENIQDYFLYISNNSKNIVLKKCLYSDNYYNEKYITIRFLTINRNPTFNKTNTPSEIYNFRKIYFGVCLK